MEILNKLMCKDVCGLIDGYLNGDKNYWKKKFDNVMEYLKFETRSYTMAIFDINCPCGKIQKSPIYNFHPLLEHNCQYAYQKRMNNIINQLFNLMIVYKDNDEMEWFIRRERKIHQIKLTITELKQKKGKYKGSFPSRNDEKHYDNFIFKMF
jgi:hypothetical protein